ncbi:uncharacterized protein DS421_16g544630 [Arachis hypogaea]|nr:uncharacterized protein DS421_16g544630 [Arachis hypogaea]
MQVKGLLQWFASQVKGLLRGALPTGKPYLVKGLRILHEVPERRPVKKSDRAEE